MMKYFFMMLALLLVGCGGHEKNILLSTGNVPPMFFHFSTKADMDRFVLDTRKYSLRMPTTKAIDFKNGKRWNGYSDRDGNSIVIDGMAGHILITTPYLASEYGERARAIHTQDKDFIKKIRRKYQYQNTTKLSYGIYGKENYFCMIKERIDKEKRHKIAYDCYKFNAAKTKAKYVNIVLTYSKPSDPTLAKQYTYTDLKRRAKRMLDSLYIKDGW